MEIKFTIPKKYESEFLEIWGSKSELKNTIIKLIKEEIKRFRFMELESQIFIEPDIIE